MTDCSNCAALTTTAHELIDKVEVLTAERDAARASVLNQAGDNLCWFDPASTPLPPKEEFLESCNRFWQQTSQKSGVSSGCMTIAQLERELAAAHEDAARLGVALENVIDAHHREGMPGFIQHEDGSFECGECGSPDGPSRSKTPQGVVHVKGCFEAVHREAEDALEGSRSALDEMLAQARREGALAEIEAVARAATKRNKESVPLIYLEARTAMLREGRDG